MKLIKASQVKRKQTYSEDTIADRIDSAMHARQTRIILNTHLVEQKDIEKLRSLGYSIYNKDNSLEISWEYA